VGIRDKTLILAMMADTEINFCVRRALYTANVKVFTVMSVCYARGVEVVRSAIFQIMV